MPDTLELQDGFTPTVFPPAQKEYSIFVPKEGRDAFRDGAVQ